MARESDSVFRMERLSMVYYVCLLSSLPRALGVSSTLHTYEDMILAKLAKHYGLPLAAILVEFASLPVTIRYSKLYCLQSSVV